MTEEQDKALDVVKIAIQMEIDGKEFYLKASKESSNELGKNLLQKLAEEEDYHRRKFVQIYDAMRVKKSWPIVDFQPDNGQKLRTIFAEATDKLESDVKPIDTELEVIQMAMDLENKSLDFYKSRSENAAGSDEKEFYEMLANEEREHHLILLDYYDYLKDPAGWFTKKEHPSLDGG